MKKIFFLLLFISFMSYVFAQTKEYRYPIEKPVIAVLIPEDWSVSGRAKLVAANLEESITIELCILPAGNIDEAVEQGNQLFASTLKKIDKDGEIINWQTKGMNCIQQNETAINDKGELVYLTITFITLSNNTRIVSLYMATPEADQKYEQTVNDIMDSIKPL